MLRPLLYLIASSSRKHQIVFPELIQCFSLVPRPSPSFPLLAVCTASDEKLGEGRTASDGKLGEGRTASDGKLGEGLGTRLPVLHDSRAHNDIISPFAISHCAFLSASMLLSSKRGFSSCK